MLGVSAFDGAVPVRISDAELLAAVVADDMAAYDTLFRRHYKAVVAYALTVSEGSDDAEDAAAEAMTLLWRKRRRIRLVHDSLLPWLLATTKNITRNAVRSRLRDFRRAKEATALSQVSEPDVELTQRDAAAFLSACLQRLSPLDRDVFVACVVEGRSYQDIAAATSLTVPAVGNRLTRARRQLREQLRAEQD